MIETVLQNYLEGVKGHLEKSIAYGKEKVAKGESTKDEYQRYLRMTFQAELENLLGVKLNAEIKEGGEK
jgi:hypothetical protein